MTDNAPIPGVQIRETTITHDDAGAVVHMRLCDVPSPYEPAALHCLLTVRVPPYRDFALLAQIERQALDILKLSLRDLMHQAAQNIDLAPQEIHLHLNPFQKLRRLRHG